MIDASEARKLANEARGSRVIAEANRLCMLIKDAANDGRRYILINEFLSKEVIRYMEDLGFSISSSFAKNEACTTISWRNKERV